MKDASLDGRPRRGATGLVRRVAAPAPRRLAPGVAAGALASLSHVGLLGTAAWLITRASLRPPILTLSVAIAGVQAFALTRGIARYLERLAVHNVALDVLTRLRLFLFDVLEPLVPGGLPERASGSLLSAFVADADAVGDAVAHDLTAAIDVASTAVLGGLLVLLIDRRVGLVLVAGTAAVITGAVLAGRLGRAAARRAAAERSALSDVVIEAVHSAPELVAYGREDLVVGQLAKVEQQASAAARSSALANGLGRSTVVALGGASLLGVVATAVADHGAGRLSPVMLSVVTFVALATLDACGSLPDALAAASKGDAASEHIGDLLDCSPLAFEPLQPAPAPARPAGVALEHAVVARGRGAPVLSDASISIDTGARVALVGPSGSGKTTALLTLAHFLECSSGRALVGSTDVATLARADLRDRIGWVPEDGHLFQASLGENLRAADPAASDEDCIDALSRVGLLGWYRELPGGLDTPLGSTGQGVSAGERQRLSLARSLLARPDVLLLDEPTTHLDPAGAQAALAELLAAAGDRSVLIVTHDVAAAARVGGVVVIDAGRTRALEPGASGEPCSGTPAPVASPQER